MSSIVAFQKHVHSYYCTQEMLDLAFHPNFGANERLKQNARSGTKSQLIVVCVTNDMQGRRRRGIIV